MATWATWMATVGLNDDSDVDAERFKRVIDCFGERTTGLMNVSGARNLGDILIFIQTVPSMIEVLGQRAGGFEDYLNSVAEAAARDAGLGPQLRSISCWEVDPERLAVNPFPDSS